MKISKTEQPYHKYVFDTRRRKFVGKFEKMYANENYDNYDSWFQDDLTHFSKQISWLILDRYNFSSILDIGCGKGTFTHLLKKMNNTVIGIDISKTAINKARAKYRNIEFMVMDIKKVLALQKNWDLVVMMGILSYLKDWKDILRLVASRVSYLYISLWLPDNPIGFVKSFEELKAQVLQYFNIKEELLWNNEMVFIFAGHKNAKK